MNGIPPLPGGPGTPPLQRTTLLFALRPGEVLLGMKRRGLGMGLWNGAGGKLAPGETHAEAAVRETHEEFGILPAAVTPVGVLRFHFLAGEGKAAWDQECVVFTAAEWEGEPHETDEMTPRWFAREAVPFDVMWADDRVWFPWMFAGDEFFGDIDFAANETMLGEPYVLDLTAGTVARYLAGEGRPTA